MRVLVDADACPVKNIIVSICKDKKITVIMFSDYAHIIDDGYSEVVTVDTAMDSVDFKIVNAMKKGDIVVTQDYGLAAMALSKGGLVIHQNGFQYTSENIDKMLFERHLNKKARQNGKRGSHIKKRTEEDNLKFANCFLKILNRA